jgi:hypothetical protein
MVGILQLSLLEDDQFFIKRNKIQFSDFILNNEILKINENFLNFLTV